MSFELIDIVDKDDLIIGTVERTPEWNATRPTLFRFVNILVKTSDGRFVLQQRAAHRKKPLVFDFPGGVVTSGLTYEQTAQKELLEEMGIDNPVRYVASFRDHDERTGELSAFAQLFEVESDGPYSGWEDEAVRLETFTTDEINIMTQRFPYLFTSGFIQAWSIYPHKNQI